MSPLEYANNRARFLVGSGERLTLAIETRKAEMATKQLELEMYERRLAQITTEAKRVGELIHGYLMLNIEQEEDDDSVS